MATATFVIEGDVNVQITITENADGTLTFDLEVLEDTGTIGDLNALFFDLYDDSRTASLEVGNVTYTNRDGTTGSDFDTAFKLDGVTKVDNYTNMNGEVINELGKFDGGVQFGTSGMATDDIMSASFTLSSSDGLPLTLADFNMQDFGIRLTSVGTIDGAREDSLKLGGNSDGWDTGGGGGPDPAVFDDYMTVTETEGFTPPFAPDPTATDMLDTGELSLLANDLDQFQIIAANGTGAPGDVIYGSAGGIARINSDGTVDFSCFDLEGNNAFEELADGESAETSFTYTTEDGLEATLFVTVLGVDGGGPGGPIG